MFDIRFGLNGVIASVAVACMALQGCSLGQGLGTGFDSSSPPQANQTTASLKIDKAFAMGPVMGAPDAVRERIGDSLNTAADTANLAFIRSAGAEVDVKLNGHLVATPSRNSTTISYIWDAYDSSGKSVGRTTGTEEIPGVAADPWTLLSAGHYQRIAVAAVEAARGTNSAGTTTIAAGAPVPARW